MRDENKVFFKNPYYARAVVEIDPMSLEDIPKTTPGYEKIAALAARKNPWSQKFAPEFIDKSLNHSQEDLMEKLYNNSKFMLQVITPNYRSARFYCYFQYDFFERTSSSLMGDESFRRKALKKNYLLCSFRHLVKDSDIIDFMQNSKEGYHAIKWLALPKEMKKEVEIAKNFIQHEFKLDKDLVDALPEKAILDYCRADPRSGARKTRIHGIEDESILQVCKQHPSVLGIIPKTQLEKPELIKKLFKQDPTIIRHLPPFSQLFLLSDEPIETSEEVRKICTRVVELNNWAKICIAELLEKYPELPDEVIELIFYAGKYASETCTTERDILMAMVEFEYFRAIEHIIWFKINQYKNDREFVLLIMNKTDRSDRFDTVYNLVSNDFKRNLSFALDALQAAPEAVFSRMYKIGKHEGELINPGKDNYYKIAEAAINLIPQLIQHVPKETERYQELVLIAASNPKFYIKDMKNVDASLKTDREFCVKLVKIRPDFLSWVEADISSHLNEISEHFSSPDKDELERISFLLSKKGLFPISTSTVKFTSVENPIESPSLFLRLK